jgi:hypothetical protein
MNYIKQKTSFLKFHLLKLQLILAKTTTARMEDCYLVVVIWKRLV